MLSSIKNAAENVLYKIGVYARCFKFFVNGLIHNGISGKKIAGQIKTFFKNPKNFIPLAKYAAYFVCPLLFLPAVIIISAALNPVTFRDATNTTSIIPRYSGFLYSQSAVKFNLNWTDGVAELTDGKAKLKLVANITPEYLNASEIKWSSSDESIASVDKDGNITAVKTGVVNITASIVNGKYSETARLNIIQPVTGLFMETSNVTLYKGSSGQSLKVKIFPDNADKTELVWSSKNPKVAAVNSQGRVTPSDVGMTEITASTPDGKFTCKCFVTVINYSVQVKNVSIKNTETELEAEKSLSLVASVTPSNAKNKTLIWSTSDNRVATVSQTGRVKALTEGEVTITAKSVNGVKASVKLNIIPKQHQSEFDLNDYSSAPITAGAGGLTYTPYTITLPGIVQIQTGLSPAPKIWRNGSSQTASETEIAEYMNPANYCDNVYKYQFLDLSSSNGVSVEALNAYLEGKGILSGKGAVFKEAAQQYNISEVYLIAHACLETGNGSSRLANGVRVNDTLVYNMFGIGAYDNSAVYSGSQRAYSESWTTPDAAIKGGARWISEHYINSAEGRQNTLYKMLWNPEHPGQHQYATDITWAIKQAESMAKILETFPEATLSYNIPVYAGQTAPEINQ